MFKFFFLNQLFEGTGIYSILYSWQTLNYDKPNILSPPCQPPYLNLLKVVAV